MSKIAGLIFRVGFAFLAVQNVDMVPVFQDGRFSVVLSTADGDGQFFRLQKP